MRLDPAPEPRVGLVACDPEAAAAETWITLAPGKLFFERAERFHRRGLRLIVAGVDHVAAALQAAVFAGVERTDALGALSFGGALGCRHSRGRGAGARQRLQLHGVAARSRRPVARERRFRRCGAGCAPAARSQRADRDHLRRSRALLPRARATDQHSDADGEHEHADAGEQQKAIRRRGRNRTRQRLRRRRPRRLLRWGAHRRRPEEESAEGHAPLAALQAVALIDTERRTAGAARGSCGERLAERADRLGGQVGSWMHGCAETRPAPPGAGCSQLHGRGQRGRGGDHLVKRPPRRHGASRPQILARGRARGARLG